MNYLFSYILMSYCCLVKIYKFFGLIYFTFTSFYYLSKKKKNIIVNCLLKKNSFVNLTLLTILDE